MKHSDTNFGSHQRRQFSLRALFIAFSLAALHLAALGAIVRSGGTHGLRAVLILVGVIAFGVAFGAASARRSAMFRAGLPFAQLVQPRPRWIRLWQFAAIPLVVLSFVQYAAYDGGDFPLMFFISTVLVAVNAVSAFNWLRNRDLSICENGIIAESRFVPWRRFERDGWSNGADGLLKLGLGLGRFQAIVPDERRPEVE
jgi:hypothetical protein